MIVTAMLASFMITLVVVVNEYYTKKIETENRLKTIADIIAWNSSASLVFKDDITAREMLSGLSTRPSIIAAFLYDGTGTVFAGYQPGGELSKNWAGEVLIDLVKHSRRKPEPGIIEFLKNRFFVLYEKLFGRMSGNILSQKNVYSSSFYYDEVNVLHLFKPILLDNELHGILHLADNQSELQALLNRFYLFISLIFVFSSFIIIVVSR